MPTQRFSHSIAQTLCMLQELAAETYAFARDAQSHGDAYVAVLRQVRASTYSSGARNLAGIVDEFCEPARIQPKST